MSWENNLMFLPSWCKLLSLQVWSCCSLWNLQKSKSYCSLSSFHSSPSAPSATGKNCWTLPASHPPGLSVEGTDGPMMLPRRPFHSALLCSPSTRTPQATWLHGVKHLAFSPAKRHCFKTQCSLWKIAIRDFICIHIYIYVWIEVIPILKHEAPTSMSLSSLAARQRWSLGSEGTVGQIRQNLMIKAWYCNLGKFFGKHDWHNRTTKSTQPNSTCNSQDQDLSKSKSGTPKMSAFLLGKHLGDECPILGPRPPPWAKPRSHLLRIHRIYGGSRLWSLDHFGGDPAFRKIPSSAAPAIELLKDFESWNRNVHWSDMIGPISCTMHSNQMPWRKASFCQDCNIQACVRPYL